MPLHVLESCRMFSLLEVGLVSGRCDLAARLIMTTRYRAGSISCPHLAMMTTSGSANPYLEGSNASLIACVAAPAPKQRGSLQLVTGLQESVVRA